MNKHVSCAQPKEQRSATTRVHDTTKPKTYDTRRGRRRRWRWRNKRRFTTNAAFAKKDKQHMAQKDTALPMQAMDKEKKKKKDVVTCFRCRGQGHYSWQCTAKAVWELSLTRMLYASYLELFCNVQLCAQCRI